MNSTISCNALARITTPQTLNIEGHIKKKNVIVLIYSGSTHIFIHCKATKALELLPIPSTKVSSDGCVVAQIVQALRQRLRLGAVTLIPNLSL